MSKKYNSVVTGLDIGSTGTRCIIARESRQIGGHDLKLEILGAGDSVCTGMRRGEVVHSDQVIESIISSVEIAELAAGVEVRSAFIGVEGPHVESFNSSYTTPIKNHKITHQDVSRALSICEHQSVSRGRRLIQSETQAFKFDNSKQAGVINPVGRTADCLEVRQRVITGSIAAIQNLTKAMHDAGIGVAGLCLSQIAASEAILSREEKILGVALVDMGGSTTHIVIYKDGFVAYTACLPFGGNQITNDIAIGLQTPVTNAEQLKINMSHSYSDIIDPRVKEMFLLIRKEITKSGYFEMLSAGVVITGGATLQEGMTEVSEFILGMPVKNGTSIGIDGLHPVVTSPRFATAVGLVKYGAKALDKTQTKIRFPIREKKIYEQVRFSLRTWITDLF
jgi:cell division protein FtsA